MPSGDDRGIFWSTRWTAILQSPPLAAGGCDFEIQAATVEQLDGFLGGVDLANRGVGQRHWGQLALGLRRLPPVVPGSQCSHLDCVGQQKGQKPYVCWAFRTWWDCVGLRGAEVPLISARRPRNHWRSWVDVIRVAPKVAPNAARLARVEGTARPSRLRYRMPLIDSKYSRAASSTVIVPPFTPTTVTGGP